MEKNAYKMMYHLEDTYWWNFALRSLVFSFMDSFILKKNRIRILDAGVEQEDYLLIAVQNIPMV